MIRNGKDIPVDQNPGTLPNVESVLFGWFQKMSFTVITKQISEGMVTETPTTSVYMGVRQPMTPQQIEMKPEGQREWIWHTIHATPDLVLSPDDEFIYLSVKHKVMSKTDYKEYGYVQYEVVENYQ